MYAAQRHPGPEESPCSNQSWDCPRPNGLWSGGNLESLGRSFSEGMRILVLHGVALWELYSNQLQVSFRDNPHTSLYSGNTETTAGGMQ